MASLVFGDPNNGQICMISAVPFRLENSTFPVHKFAQLRPHPPPPEGCVPPVQFYLLEQF